MLHDATLDDALQEKRRLTDERVAWLEAELAGLDREWATTRYFFATSAAAIPATWFWGWAIGFLVLVLAISFVSVSLYIVGVRRDEYRVELSQLRRERDALERIKR